MRIKNIIVPLLMVLALSLNVIPMGEGIDHRPNDLSTIDSYLLQEMEARESTEMIEIIVQFRSDHVTNGDLREVERIGMEIVYELHVIHGVFAIGTKEQILELSSYERTLWMEFNNRMTPALHETTGVISATTPWTAEVKDGGYQNFNFNTQSYLAGLDGSGVTVAVVDTGIDGQHPDFDYGEKMIYNKHKNGADDPWIEKENSDTSYGHGTHCAGIVAGNGDASGGQNRGVAPGANLIGLGGDWVPFPDNAPIHWAVLEGLEWVYENSKPGNNPHNIRVVSNSWGGAGPYDPDDAITVISNKLTYENNVLVVFAAMNSGEGNHDGETDTTSQQSKIPSVISVAATSHDGNAMANFSSRGQKGDHNSYPDISAPGVDIWATRPRGTWLGEYQLIDEDMYYMAISGTSMATPHVAGLAAIMFQAAPSLTVSEHHDTYNGLDNSWTNRDDTRIHEIEYILQMTGDMIPFTGDNGVPAEREKGVSGRHMDFAQGYGMVNTENAVAVALTLEKMREDEPEATVDDALKEWEDILGVAHIKEDTDVLSTGWRGEWAQLTNGSNPGSSATFATDQSHQVFIPQSALLLEIDLAYSSYDLNLGTTGRIDVTLDWNGDGFNDIAPQIFDIDGNKHYEVDLSGTEGASEHKGKYWTFNIEGEGIKFFLNDPDDEFLEALIEYTINVNLRIEPDASISLDERDFTPYMSPWRFSDPSVGYDGAQITLVRHSYDVTDVEYQEPFLEKYGETIAASIILLVIGAVLNVGYKKRREPSSDENSNYQGTDEWGGEQQVLEARRIDELNNGEQTKEAHEPDEPQGTVEWEDSEA